MSINFKDYYEVLHVTRSATQDEIKKAYRKLARKYHPDVSKEVDAEGKFKELTEAYEVLGSIENRKKYDQIGVNSKSGQEFTPPSGWENTHFEYHTPGDLKSQFDKFGGASEFFEMLFGEPISEDHKAGASGREWAMRGPDYDTDLTVSLREAFHGAKKRINLTSSGIDGDGKVVRKNKTYDIKIPPGTLPEKRIRLRGQGAPGRGGGPAGDLYIRVKIAPDPDFIISGKDLRTTVPISPWEAALGAKLNISTLDGTVILTVPAGVQSGQSLRLRGKGFPGAKSKQDGDLFVTINIKVPENLTDDERKLFETLSEKSLFNPRSKE